MTYQPVIIGSGLVGYQFLRNTQERQQTAFNESASIKRETEYFREAIKDVESAEELVADRRLLNVALTAFGLQDDINNKYFIQKILEEGISKQDSLANKLADERYKTLAEEFSCDLPVPNIVRSYFSDEMIDRYLTQSFEIAVGEQDDTLRLALNFDRNIGQILEKESSDSANWFRLMGTPPLRTVIDTALNLPSSFSQLDIDRQLEVYRDKSQSRFGVSEISDMSDPEVSRRIIQTYLVQNQAAQSAASSSGSVALALLSNAGY